MELLKFGCAGGIAVVIAARSRSTNRSVYRVFTKAELDKQYSPSMWSLRDDTVGVHCRNLADHSTLVREQLAPQPGALERGVRYGAHAMHRMDFYHPPTGFNDESAICIYLHGGY